MTHPAERDPYEEVIGAIAAMNSSKQFGPATVRVYLVALSDVPIRELREVVWEIVKTRVFPPTVAEILTAVVKRRLGLPEPFAAYEQTSQAVSNGATRSLPESMQRALKAVGGSWEFRNTEQPSILRSQFLKAYEEFKLEDETRAVLALSPTKKEAITSGN